MAMGETIRKFDRDFREGAIRLGPGTEPPLMSLIGGTAVSFQPPPPFAEPTGRRIRVRLGDEIVAQSDRATMPMTRQAIGEVSQPLRVGTALATFRSRRPSL